MSPILPVGSPGAREQAAQALEEGGLVVVPTDTVYGLAARIDRPEALAGLFAVKVRSPSMALPVLVASAGQAASLGRMEGLASRLGQAFWPGGLTLVLARQPGFAADLGGDPATVGLRVPDLAPLRALLELTGPLATTSANLSGQPTPGTVAGIAAQFGSQVALYLDGGPAPSAAPSTVVSLTGGGLAVLRPGVVAVERIQEVASAG